MSIAEKSNGILETHVQWEDVEQAIQTALKTTASFGPDKAVQNIGEGNGFLSRISLIHPDWQNASEDLPKCFVAKICTPITMMDFTDKTDNQLDVSSNIANFISFCLSGHNIECDTYRIMHKYGEGRIPLPKIYYSQKFSDENQTKGFILMEYFDGLVTCHLTDNITLDAMKKILRTVAIWQGIGMKMTEEERSIFPTTTTLDIFECFFKPDMSETCRKGLDEFCGSEHAGTVQNFYELMLKLCTKDYFMKVDSIPDTLGYKRVFCHGDLWSNNILWTKNDDLYNIRAHIDFQTAGLNSAASDFVLSTAACLSGSDRRKHYKELLSVFYGYLREEVQGELPYTFEQLEQSLEYTIPVGALLLTPMLQPLNDYLSTKYPESAATNKAILLEKTLALMEDALASNRDHPLN